MEGSPVSDPRAANAMPLATAAALPPLLPPATLAALHGIKQLGRRLASSQRLYAAVQFTCYRRNIPLLQTGGTSRSGSVNQKQGSRLWSASADLTTRQPS